MEVVKVDHPSDHHRNNASLLQQLLLCLDSLLVKYPINEVTTGDTIPAIIQRGVLSIFFSTLSFPLRILPFPTLLLLLLLNNAADVHDNEVDQPLVLLIRYLHPLLLLLLCWRLGLAFSFLFAFPSLSLFASLFALRLLTFLLTSSWGLTCGRCSSRLFGIHCLAATVRCSYTLCISRTFLRSWLSTCILSTLPLSTSFLVLVVVFKELDAPPF
mmetsp:Transcript_43139/g.111821  ORF Transcript_43139/g.111821 Transcript_43139/m.111821 type:complete len:214 (+) Transcript_43139:597-1238(+)